MQKPPQLSGYIGGGNLFPLAGDGINPGQALVYQLTESIHSKTLMLSLTHFVLDLAGDLMAKVCFTFLRRQCSYLTFAAYVLGGLTFLPGYFDQSFFLPACCFRAGKRFFTFSGQPGIYPCKLLIARVIDSLPAVETVDNPDSSASVVKLTGIVPLTIFR